MKDQSPEEQPKPQMTLSQRLKAKGYDNSRVGQAFSMPFNMPKGINPKSSGFKLTNSENETISTEGKGKDAEEHKDVKTAERISEKRMCNTCISNEYYERPKKVIPPDDIKQQKDVEDSTE